jgi:hypothetical protein
MPRASYDEQGNYFHHLSMVAGWDQKRVNSLLVKRFKATHWNVLTEAERLQAIKIMKAYAAKAEKGKQAKLRQMIVARVARNGHDLGWLHGVMVTWGYGDSLRLLTYQQTIEVWNHVQECFKGRTEQRREA